MKELELSIAIEALTEIRDTEGDVAWYLKRIADRALDEIQRERTIDPEKAQ